MEQFKQKADTFDMLLFKTRNVTSKLVRGFTNSEFDHAAMIIKCATRPSEVFFLHATNDVGVDMANFADY